MMDRRERANEMESGAGAPGPRIAVVGRGPAGLAAAVLLSHAGLKATLIGPKADPDDGRSVAIMLPAVRLLTDAGAWPADRSWPLRTLRIVDDTGRLLRAPEAGFDASEIGETAFAHSIPAADLAAGLEARLADDKNITLASEPVTQVLPGGSATTLVTASGRSIDADLVIAADGRRSLCRDSVGIRLDIKPYPQSAVVFDITHQRDHRDVSTEFHRPNGPFTLVPIRRDRCGVVWVEDKAGADRLLACDDRALARAVDTASHRLLGRVAVAGPRRAYPLAHGTASEFAAKGVLLIAEAAHVMPPIGAQGLNLGLRDAAAAVDAIVDHCRNGVIDRKAVERTYSQSRGLDIGVRMTGVDILNRSLLSDLVPVQGVRAAGLGALAHIGPLRRLFMREGMAPRLGLPRSMRSAEGL